MASTGKIWTALLLGVALWANCGLAQTLPQTSDDALQAMAQQAGVIFTGQVVAVRRQSATGGATGVVEIDFAVEDAVRGVSGGSYTLREWAGLWVAGDAPFRVGQRYLMLLHSPGAAGLSSPVGGTDGAIPIRGVGPAVALDGAAPRSAAAGEVAGLAAATDGLVVDLRWVGTRVANPVVYQLGSVAQATIRPVIGSAVAPIEGIPASAAKGMAYPAMLAMLRSWEKR